jgi:hypothetical protein
VSAANDLWEIAPQLTMTEVAQKLRKRQQKKKESAEAWLKTVPGGPWELSTLKAALQNTWLSQA